MSAQTTCPQCQNHLRLPSTAIQHRLQCPRCGHIFAPPAPPAAENEAMPAGPQPAVAPSAPVDAIQKPVTSENEQIPMVLPAPRSVPQPPPLRRWPSRDWDEERERPRFPTAWIVAGAVTLGLFMLMAVGVAGYWMLSVRGPRPAGPIAKFSPPAKMAKPMNPGPVGGKVPVPNPPNVPPGPDINAPLKPANPISPKLPAADKPAVKPPPPSFPLNPNVIVIAKEKEPILPAEISPRLIKLHMLQAPAKVEQMVYSAKHKLLFLRDWGSGILVVDSASKKVVGLQKAIEQFTDLDLSPDEDVLYAADYGKEKTGYGTPIKPHRVHRFDLKTRQWSWRLAPKIAYRVESVDQYRFLLLEHDQWVDVTLNLWDKESDKITEQARAKTDFCGDIEFDHRTGRIIHGNSDLSSQRITALRLTDDFFVMAESLSSDQGWAQKAGGSVVLSTDGSKFYYGCKQVDALNIRTKFLYFPQCILAATGTLAFGSTAYYDAKSKARVGTLGYYATAFAPGSDGTELWAFELKTNRLHFYSVEKDSK